MTTRAEAIEQAATGLMELIDDLGERSLLIEPDPRGTYRQRIRALSTSLALPPETAPATMELREAAAVVEALLTSWREPTGHGVWASALRRLCAASRAAPASPPKAADSSDDDAMPTEAEAYRILTEAGIDPAASYERLRERVKRETGTELPPLRAASPPKGTPPNNDKDGDR